jgi:hypothetical protein
MYYKLTLMKYRTYRGHSTTFEMMSGRTEESVGKDLLRTHYFAAFCVSSGTLVQEVKFSPNESTRLCFFC